MVVEPQVIAAQHAVEAYVYLLSAPLLWQCELRAIVARQGVRTVVFRLTEAVCLPASGHGDGAPSLGYGWHGLVVCYAFHHLQSPLAVQTALHSRVGDGQHTVKGIHHLCRILGGSACSCNSGSRRMLGGSALGTYHDGHAEDVSQQQKSSHCFTYLRSIFVYLCSLFQCSKSPSGFSSALPPCLYTVPLGALGMLAASRRYSSQ